MPKFFTVQFPQRKPNKIDFQDFVNISKGLSISSAAASSDDSSGSDFIELGLSKSYNLRIEARGSELHVSMVSIRGTDYSPVRFEIIRDDEPVTAELLEYRLYHLRQVYALALLIENGREREVGDLLKKDSHADIESHLVSQEDKLVIQEATPGSLLVTFIAKTKSAQKALSYACAVPFAHGRSALFRILDAKSDLAQLEAADKKLDVRYKNVSNAIELAEKIQNIQDPKVRDLIMGRLLSDVKDMSDVNIPPANKMITSKKENKLLISSSNSVDKNSSKKKSYINNPHGEDEQ